MALTISSFKDQFQGGVRANLFSCSISSDWLEAHGQAPVQFFVKGTSIPASTVGNIDVPYRGRQLKVPGDRTYADWTATIFNDENMTIHAKFEEWMQQIQNHGMNVQKLPAEKVYGTGSVVQLNRKGKPLMTYTINMYPTEVAAIDLAWDSNDAVEEYSVTFAVNHWIAGPGTVSTASGNDPKWGVEVSADSTGNIGADIWASMKI